MLTAAHCLTGSDLSDFRVFVNLTNFDDKPASFDAMVIESRPHPDYSEPDYSLDIDVTVENDVALLKLDRQILSVDPVDLNLDPTVPTDGEEVNVFGHGLIKEFLNNSGEQMEYVSNLQVVTVEVVPIDVCIEEYVVGSLDYVDAEMQLCTALPGKSPCQGDSGGPLVLEREGMPDLQVGIVSFAEGCAREGLSNVYARVSTYFDWIRTGICELTTNNLPAYCSIVPTPPPVTAVPVTSEPAVPITTAPATTAPAIEAPFAEPSPRPVVPVTIDPQTETPVRSLVPSGDPVAEPSAPPIAPVTIAPQTTGQPETGSPITFAPVEPPDIEAPLTPAKASKSRKSEGKKSKGKKSEDKTPITVAPFAPVAPPESEAPITPPEASKSSKKEGKKSGDKASTQSPITFAPVTPPNTEAPLTVAPFPESKKSQSKQSEGKKSTIEKGAKKYSKQQKKSEEKVSAPRNV